MAAVTAAREANNQPAEKTPEELWWDTWKHIEQWSYRPLEDIITLIEDLLSKDVPFTAKHEAYMTDGMTALHFAAQMCDRPWGVNLLKYLLQKEGIEEMINAQDVRHGLTPLLHAIAKSANRTEHTHEETVEQPGEAVDEQGRRPILQALDLFLEHGADVNYAPYHGSAQTSAALTNGKNTALGIAAACGDASLMVNLIRVGAKVNLRRRSSSFTTIDREDPVVHPLYTAALHGNIDVVKLLRKYGASAETSGNVIHAAAYAHNQELINLFVSCGVDINLTDEIDETALFTAVRSNDLPTVKTLLSHGVNVNSPTQFMDNALAEVCSMNTGDADIKRQILEALLEAGCDINQKGFRGQTALHYTARTGDADTARLLLEHGADPNIITDFGLNAIQVAFCHHTVSESHWKTIRHLIHYNAEWTVDDRAREANCRMLCPCKEDCHMLAVDMMYLAGCPVKQMEALARGPITHPVKQKLHELGGKPLGLQESCRRAIRQKFTYKTVSQLDKLELPSILMNYVKFSDLSYENEE